MRNRILSFLASLILIICLIHVPAHAFGGFVSPKGSAVYHDIYCSSVEGYHLDELRWYDTPEKAEAAGLSPCEECDAAEGFDFSYDIETTWKTSDHLIQSAMELEYESGYLEGRDSGYEEGFSDGQTGYEYSTDDYYDLGYDDGYQVGEGNGYDRGYDDGVASGKSKAEQELRSELEAKYARQLESDLADRLTDVRITTALITAAVCTIALNLWKKHAKKT